ncbi:MAG TPA: hypothetical protein PKV98_19515 [Burkholderiaceae bacterium]|nr:hypothetical protein [Burkholderiaceae bacterium]
MSGFATGLLAGTRAGLDAVSAYRQGMGLARAEEEWKRDDAEYARKEEDRKVREGMNQAGAMAAERGYDKNGFATVIPAYEGGPGDTAGGVTKPPVMEDARRPEQKVLDGMTAAEQFALKNKRFDLALDAHVKSEAIASQYRDKDRAEALQRFEMSGDPNELVSHVKRFARDGVDFDKPTRNADGTFTITGKMPDGTPFKQENLKPEQVRQLFVSYSDPVRAQAAAAQRAQDLQKAQIEIEVKRAGLPLQSFKPGDMVIDPRTGKFVQAGGLDYKIINGAEGEGQRLIAITYGAGGQVISEVDVSGHMRNVNSFNKIERARADDVSKEINKALDLEKTQGLGSPELSALSLKANATASDLIAANRINPVNLEAGRLADYAVKIARGDKSIVIQPIEYKYNGIVYGKPDGFIVDGKPVYTNPQQVREIESKILQDKQAAAAPRMAPERPTNFGGQSPANFPRVDRATQESRDSDRVRILRDELSGEQSRLAQLKNDPNARPDDVARVEANIAALNREIGLAAPKGTPMNPGAPAQPAAAAPAPTGQPMAAAPAPAAAAPAMSAAPQAAALPTPTMSGAIVPAEQRAAQMAQLTEEANRATAVLNSRASTPAQMSAARTALRDVRAKLKELNSTYTPESARLQAVILNPRSSPAEIADARATLRSIRDRNSTTASLPMSQ